MVKHVLLWQLQDELSEEDRLGTKKFVKTSLEKLPGVIPGLVDMKVVIDPLPTSNTDIYMEATVTDKAALQVYQVHPEHEKVKEELLKVCKMRLCMDYEVSDWNAENLFRG